jgi:hypothetical protein
MSKTYGKMTARELDAGLNTALWTFLSLTLALPLAVWKAIDLLIALYHGVFHR